MKDKTPAAFFAKLAALMDEFKVEIEVTEESDNWSSIAKGIEFDFRGEWDGDGNVIRSSSVIEFNSKYFDASDAADQSKINLK